MIDKSINKINCVDFRGKLAIDNQIHLYSDRTQVINDTHFTNGSSILLDGQNKTILFDITKLEHDVCLAEIESQKLDTKLNAYTSPFDSFFGILMILFAGGWSDKRGKRKPCMILPMIGELANLIGMQCILFLMLLFFLIVILKIWNINLYICCFFLYFSFIDCCGIF